MASCLSAALGFENAYALAMARNRAATLGINSLADLARHRNLTVAGDYEFFGRPEWRALNEAYGLSFASQRQMQPEFMYPAVAAGDVDVISAYTSDGRVAQFDLKILDDPKRAIPLMTRSFWCRRPAPTMRPWTLRCDP